MTDMTSTPTLDHFVENYVHEDWADLGGTVWSAVRLFVAESPKAPQLPDDVDRFLREHPDEAEAEAYLDALGIGYLPGPDEGGYRGWLAEVAERVRAEIRQLH